MKIPTEEDINNQIKPIIEMIKNNHKISNNISKYFLKDVRSLIVNLNKIEQTLNNKKNINNDLIYNKLKSILEKNLIKGKRLQDDIDNNAVEKEIKKIFRALIGPWAYQSHIIKWSCDKPKGYHGDFKMLEFMYNNHPSSNGIGYYFEKILLDNPYVEAVRMRKEKMADLLKNFIQTSNLPTIKIMNLACGSCRDIKKVFNELSENHFKKLNFICVDKDLEALNYSKTLLLEEKSKVNLKFYQENILNFSKQPKHYQKLFGKQNLIYCIGLADYLLDITFGELIHFCYGLLSAKGNLIIAHKDTEIDKISILYPEWISNEWKFFPRKEIDLVNILKKNAEGDYSIKIVRDETKYIFFTVLSKNK